MSVENLIFRRVEHRSEGYERAVGLRTGVLREPLGLVFTTEQLDGEYSSSHFVGELNGAVVATALVSPDPGHVARIRQVAVSPTCQGKGFGAALMRFVESWSVENGYRSAVLHSRATVGGFYESLGYVREGDEFEEIGIPHILMTKALNS